MKIKAQLENEKDDQWEIVFIDFPNKTYEIINTETGKKKTLPLAKLKIKFER